MLRCLDLAGRGLGRVAPNPMVGSVLVFENRVIGEGYHEVYGQAHAEVNCLRSVRKEDILLIPQSTMYVSLEPCAHFGKTPPCADTLVAHGVPQVVIGCRDPFEQVDGKGIGKLKEAGVEVVYGILEKQCKDLNKRFFLFHSLRRPYIILKWAQSANNKIAANDGERMLISNHYSNRLVHKWRTREAAIMVGTNTALLDNPRLTSRLWPGKNPIRVVVDLNLRLPARLHLFDKEAPTIVFNLQKHTFPANAQDLETETGTYYYKLAEATNPLPQMLAALYRAQVQSILVEGGAQLLQSFLDEGYWDEARVITNKDSHAGPGIDAPFLRNAEGGHPKKIGTDIHRLFINQSPMRVQS